MAGPSGHTHKLSEKTNLFKMRRRSLVQERQRPTGPVQGKRRVAYHVEPLNAASSNDLLTRILDSSMVQVIQSKAAAASMLRLPSMQERSQESQSVPNTHRRYAYNGVHKTSTNKVSTRGAMPRPRGKKQLSITPTKTTRTTKHVAYNFCNVSTQNRQEHLQKVSKSRSAHSLLNPYHNNARHPYPPSHTSPSNDANSNSSSPASRVQENSFEGQTRAHARTHAHTIHIIRTPYTPPPPPLYT